MMSWRRSAACLLLTCAASCGGDSGPTDPSSPVDPPPPVGGLPIVQPIRVRTSDGRELGEFSMPATVGTHSTLTLADLRDRGIATDGVDPNFFAMLNDNEGDQVGNFVARTTTGTLQFLPARRARVLWLMSSLNNADYACAAGTPSFLVDRSGTKRYAAARRLTAENNTIADFQVVAGNAAPLVEGLNLLNQAWTVNGLRYAGITWLDETPTADINGGLGRNVTLFSLGYHIDKSFVVRPELQTRTKINATVEEAFEVFLTFDNLCGQSTNQTLFEVPLGSTDLSPSGKDIVRFGALMRTLF